MYIHLNNSEYPLVCFIESVKFYQVVLSAIVQLQIRLTNCETLYEEHGQLWSVMTEWYPVHDIILSELSANIC